MNQPAAPSRSAARQSPPPPPLLLAPPPANAYPAFCKLPATCLATARAPKLTVAQLLKKPKLCRPQGHLS